MNLEASTEAGGGLGCLLLAASLHNVQADSARLAHEFGSAGGKIGMVDLARAAKSIGFKTRLTVINWKRLASMPLLWEHSAVAEEGLGGRICWYLPLLIVVF